MTTGDRADERPPADARPDGGQHPGSDARPDGGQHPGSDAESDGGRSSRSPASPGDVDVGKAGPDDRAGVRRGGPVWLILGVVAAALLVCCCSAVVGLMLAWAAGLFDTPPT